MKKSKPTKGEFKKSARIVSDYENDMIFEQPRENLIQQEFISYELTNAGGFVKLRKSTKVRKFHKDGGYNDTETIEVLG
tara:strand:- start:1571 stop:1807 length:237 start_codon:yes stop_codon:yes gene_type:complete